MGFPCAICGVCLRQSHIGFDPKDPFLVGLWAECSDCNGYVGGYAFKGKCLVVYRQFSLLSGGGKGSP